MRTVQMYSIPLADAEFAIHLPPDSVFRAVFSHEHEAWIGLAVEIDHRFRPPNVHRFRTFKSGEPLSTYTDLKYLGSVYNKWTSTPYWHLYELVNPL